LAAKERKELIEKLEHNLQVRVLTIITGDRQGMETRIAPDILPLVSEHLSNIKPTEDLALFLYTPGGDTIVGWGLVSLLRQYSNKISVLVPFRALSCGTLIALGADNLIMGTHGFLSPIDPSVSSPFNPQAPGVQQPGMVTLLPVSVEDMSGFLDLARNEIGPGNEKPMIEVIKILADKVHPLALGAVYRAREQTSSLAKRLLSMHLHDEVKVDHIVSQLTHELPTHNYLIGRLEAENEIKIDIKKPSAETDRIMWNLYKDYENWLQLTEPFSAEHDLGTEQNRTIRYERAAVESIYNGKLSQHIFVTENVIFRAPGIPAGMQGVNTPALVRTLSQGWIAAEDGKAI